MGTKDDPGEFDCYDAALPDEPMFVLLARDPDFERLVRKWAKRREAACACGDRPIEDMKMVHEARICADSGVQWRRSNLGKWRKET